MFTQLNNLRHQQNFMRYFHNTSWLIGEKVLRMFVGLFVGIWVARYLGPKQFGLISYAQSFVFLFTILSTLGLDSLVVRELVKNENKRDILLGTTFGLKLIGAIFTLPLLAAAILFTSNDYLTNTLIFVIASTTIFQSFNVIDYFYQSNILSKYVALSNTITLALSSIIKIILILYHAPLISFALMSVFDSLVLAVGLIYFYKKESKLKLSNWAFDKKTAKALLKDSWPLILAGLLVSIYMRVDQIMIKEIIGANAVGQYAAAVRLSEAWYFIPMAIASSVFPAIINAKKTSEELYYKYLQSLFTVMFWIAVSIAMPVSIFNEQIIYFLYGDAYQLASQVLVIHIWAGIFVFLGVASGKWFISENLQIISFYRSFYGMLINITLNFILIPKVGIIGAAISTLISHMFSAYIFDIFNKKTKLMFAMKTKTLLAWKSV